MLRNLARLLSYAWPVRVWNGPGAHGDLELTWEYGRLVVNTANANQSFGSTHRVWRAAMRDARIQRREPGTALVLGYGVGSVGHILREELGLATAITGVDDDEAMLDMARTHFPLKPREAIELIRSDAFAFVANHGGTFDLVVVDLFHDLDFAPGVEEPRFVAGIRHLVSLGGAVMINTVAHDEKSAARSARLGDELRLVFQEVLEQRYEGINRVYIAL